MADTEGAFRLTFVEGRGLLSLAGRDIPGFGRVEKLELEIPNLRFPFDLSGGVTRFKNHRLRLRELAVSLATVLGFVSFVPGGAVVREAALAKLTELMAPHLGSTISLVGAVLLRLVWLVAELIASGVLWWRKVF